MEQCCTGMRIGVVLLAIATIVVAEEEAVALQDDAINVGTESEMAFAKGIKKTITKDNKLLQKMEGIETNEENDEASVLRLDKQLEVQDAQQRKQSKVDGSHLTMAGSDGRDHGGAPATHARQKWRTNAPSKVMPSERDQTKNPFIHMTSDEESHELGEVDDDYDNGVKEEKKTRIEQQMLQQDTEAEAEDKQVVSLVSQLVLAVMSQCVCTFWRACRAPTFPLFVLVRFVECVCSTDADVFRRWINTLKSSVRTCTESCKN